MSISRLFGRMLGTTQDRVPASGNAPAPENEVPELNAEPIVPFHTFFIVVELDDAETVVGPLFKRRFHTDSFPDNPRHYVAFTRMDDASLLSLGYVHYTLLDDIALCGGLVIDDQHYRRLPKSFRQEIVRAGGIAENLMRISFDRLPTQIRSIWGHVGDRQAEKVDLRVGFEHTGVPFLMAVWRDASLTEDERNALIERVKALTPF